MNLSIKEVGYDFLVRLVWTLLITKRVPVEQISNDLYIIPLIKLNLLKYDVKLLKCKRSPIWIGLWYI